MRALRALRIAGFLALIALPLVGMTRSRGDLTNEKRHRAARPVLTAATWRAYPDAFDAYFRDAFGFREQLIHWHNLLAIKELRESPVHNVIIGGSGRLFYGGFGDGIDLSDFAGRVPVAPAELDRWIAHQEARRAQYAALGARYLIVLVPNKQTVYPEDVPLRYGPHRPGVLDALVARLRGHTDLDVLDLRPILKAHRDEPDYYNTDTHWNPNGAWWGAHAITEHLHPWLPTLPVLRREDYDIHRTPGASGDLAQMLAMTGDFDDTGWVFDRHGGAPKPSVWDGLHYISDQPGSTAPRVLVLGDSFGIELAAMLSPAFSHLHYYYSARAGYDAALPAKERPNVVILVLVERYLRMLADQ